MIEPYSNNTFFQDNAVLDVVNDISKDFGYFKNQLSTNQFNNVSQFETKLENVQQYIHYVDSRITNEVNGLFNSCKNQFGFVNSQFSNVMTVGSNVDSKVQNVENRVNNLYDDLRNFEININSRLSSLEEIKAMFARMDQTLIHVNSQLENLFYLYGKSEATLNQFILNKEASQATRNPFDCPEQLYKERSKKIEEIKQNLNKNINTEQPAYNVTKNNFDIKLDNLEVKERKFDFNAPTEGFSFNQNTTNSTDTSKPAKYQSSKLTVIPEQPSPNEKDQSDTNSAKAKIQKNTSTSKQPSLSKTKSVGSEKKNK